MATASLVTLPSDQMTTASLVTLPSDLGKVNDNLEVQRKDGVSVTTVFRQAAQADVVLSEERDSYYAHTLLSESASELTEALLGSRRATILAPEIRALASYMYFGLTNLTGKQTLGQEYCDIGLAKKGAVSTPPLPGSSLRLYAFLRVLVPYLQERLREGWHGLRSLSDPLGRDGAAVAGARARARARAALSPPAGIAPRTLNHPAPEARADVQDDAEADGEGQSTGVPTSVSFRPRGSTLLHPQTARRRLRRRCFRVMVAFLEQALSWVRRNRPAISGAFEWALRVHLAAFYFDGRYANLAMRAVGARLAYTRAKDEPRSRYAILGVFSLVQAVGEAASACAEATAGWRATVAAATRARSDRLPRHTETNRMGEGEPPDEKSASSRVPAVTPEKTPADAALFPRSRRRCSLCMSPRQNAAATPCGHLVCWECVVGWCQTNPECPLCRQPASPQSIVCLYQYA